MAINHQLSTINHLHRILGGDALQEAQILCFIAARYGARTLLDIPQPVAAQIIRRPADFLRAVKRHCEPELF